MTIVFFHTDNMQTQLSVSSCSYAVVDSRFTWISLLVQVVHSHVFLSFSPFAFLLPMGEVQYFCAICSTLLSNGKGILPSFMRGSFMVIHQTVWLLITAMVVIKPFVSEA